MKNPQVQLTQFIKAPQKKVFEAWVTPEIAMKWYCPVGLQVVSFKNDFKVGGTYEHVMKNGEQKYDTHGKYLEINPYDKLVFTWGPLGMDSSVVTLLFKPVNGGTEVSLTHEKLPEDQVASHKEGWTGALLHLSQFMGG